MAKQSVSERIRKMLAEGKSVKEISKRLKCSAGLVYQVRAYDKKKSDKIWATAQVSTSANKVKARPNNSFIKTGEAARQMRENALNALAAKPGAIRYGETVFVPKDYPTPKQPLLTRIKNWFMGV